MKFGFRIPSLKRRISARKASILGFKTNNSILDKHFELSEKIPFYYRQREKEGMLNKAIETCKQQIELAPKAINAFLKKYPWQTLPSHRGYERLAIILNKQGKRKESIVLCEQAKEQGWAGDWDKRIERYKKRLTGIS